MKITSYTSKSYSSSDINDDRISTIVTINIISTKKMDQTLAQTPQTRKEEKYISKVIETEDSIRMHLSKERISGSLQLCRSRREYFMKLMPCKKKRQQD